VKGGEKNSGGRGGEIDANLSGDDKERLRSTIRNWKETGIGFENQRRHLWSAEKKKKKKKKPEGLTGVQRPNI